MPGTLLSEALALILSIYHEPWLPASFAASFAKRLLAPSWEQLGATACSQLQPSMCDGAAGRLALSCAEEVRSAWRFKTKDAQIRFRNSEFDFEILFALSCVTQGTKPFVKIALKARHMILCIVVLSHALTVRPPRVVATRFKSPG